MLIINFSLYLFSFLAIWLGAGLIIKSVDHLARKLRLSSFALSFFVLGLLTSIPETAVSINAVSNNNPEIFVGTLLGGTIVIFLFIIPILAILGRGIKLNHDLDPHHLALALFVMAAPGFFVTDHKVTSLEGIFLIFLYAAIFYYIQKKHGVFDQKQTEILSVKSYSFLDLAKVISGIIIVFFSSQYIVYQTIAFSDIFQIPAFYISLIVLAVGTNLPELSLAIQAIVSGKKDIAFGDYLGSASANTLLFGFFTLLNKGEVLTVNNFAIAFVFIATGLGLFYFFAKSHKDISQKEGLALLLVYILFILYELSKSVA